MRGWWISVIMVSATVASAAIDEQTLMPAAWHCRAGDVIRIRLVEDGQRHTEADDLAGRVLQILPDEQVQVEANREILMNGAQHRVTLRAVARIRDIHPGNRILSTSLHGVELYFDQVLAAPARQAKRSLPWPLNRIF